MFLSQCPVALRRHVNHTAQRDALLHLLFKTHVLCDSRSLPPNAFFAQREVSVFSSVSNSDSSRRISEIVSG